MNRVFFTDRDLGKKFPAVLRAAGFFVETHVDHFAPDAADDEWLPAVGRRQWIVLTHDRRIRYKSNERDAVMSNGIAMFVLVGSVPHPELARAFVATRARMDTFLNQNSPPFIAKVYRGLPSPRPGDFRPGRVELWLSGTEWRRR